MKKLYEQAISPTPDITNIEDSEDSMNDVQSKRAKANRIAVTKLREMRG